MVATVYFADKNALKDSLLDTLVVAQPTFFLGVPRIWEKLQEKARNIDITKTSIAKWAKAQGFYYYMNKMNGIDCKNWSYDFAKWLVFDKVKAALGLNRCRTFLTAAAPLSIDVKTFFLYLDIPIRNAYGMSECSGAHSVTTPKQYK
jgi:long-chain-fatty-acid--CoA ligase ACSBG